jgi:hypothetical protein
MWETDGYRPGDYLDQQLRMYTQKTNKQTDMAHARKFWMITGDGNSPRVRHSNRQDAVREAERLAKSNPGTEFFVLEAVEMLTQPTGFVRQEL